MSKLSRLEDSKKQINSSTKVNRRTFLKIIGGLGVSAAAMALFSPLPFNLGSLKTLSTPNQSSTQFSVKRTVCLQCHSGCGVQVTIADPGMEEERAINIAGNPYHPNTMLPNIDFDTDPTTLIDDEGYPIFSGRICAKGRAGLQALYDPQRIKNPLKRVGPRGSGQWQKITWDQALSEITGATTSGNDHTNRLLPAATGSGTYSFDGLKQIKEDDPNKFVFMVGRSEHGRKELTDRLWKYGYGTKNHRNDHTSICELSHHVGFALAFQGKTHLGTDIMNAEYILWFGTSPLEAGFPMQNLSSRLMEAKNPSGTQTPLKMVVVDPRFSRTAAKADRWVPVTPGADAALACGMMAYMVSNDWFDEGFLRNANVDTAEDAIPKEFSATDATHLVITDTTNANERNFATADDLAITLTSTNHVVTTDGTAGTATEVTGNSVVGSLGDYKTLDNNYKTTPITVNGIECKTVFQLFVEKLWEPLVGTTGTLDDLLEYYENECGDYVTVSTIKELATEFWSHGKRSVCNFYRGSVQHTNGTYTALALINLNLLVGNLDRRGGLTTGGSHWHETGNSGTSQKGPYVLDSSDWAVLQPAFGGAKASTSGLNIAREKVTFAENWENNTGNPPTDNDYPAERPFFPRTSNIWQEVVAGIRHGAGSEPGSTGFYQPLAVWFHMANPGYSMPGAQLADEMLLDLDPDDSTRYKVPLAMTTEIVMGETTKYCDYILPDVSYLERWATTHIAPNVPITASGVRQPVLSAPYYPDTKMAEDIYIDVGHRLQLPGFYGTDGTDGFGTSLPANRRAFTKAEDWYNKMIINFALESGKVPKGDDTFYDRTTDWVPASADSTEGGALDDLEEILIDYVLDRGGVFEDGDTSYANAASESGGINDDVGDYMRKRYGKIANFYSEALATTENCMANTAGVYFSGIGFYDRIKNAIGEDIRNRDETDYPFMLSTYKTVLHTQSRTIANPWLTQIEGTNGVLINDEDATSVGIKNGDSVKVTSRGDLSVTGDAIITKGIMKGVVSISHSFGHTQYGAEDWTEDSTTRKGIQSRTAGISANKIMRLDESLNNTVCLQDLIGGSACFYDTFVKVEKA